MTITEFIEKAVQGGWNGPQGAAVISHRKFGLKTAQDMYEAYVLLSPEAWKAVGKTEGWRSLNDEYWCTNGWDHVADEWLVYMHRMIDVLASGKTIEEYLATL